MTFLDLAKKRFSCRKYLARPVSEDKLLYVLEAGRVAPTMGNTQSVRIIVLNTRENIRKLGLHAQIHDAPLALLVCADSRLSYKEPVQGIDSAVADATVVTTHLMLAATEVGLGSIWLMKFNAPRIKEMFSLPPNYQLIHILGMGLPDEEKESDRHDLARLPLSKIVTYQK